MSRKTISLADWQQQAGISPKAKDSPPEQLVYSTDQGRITAEKSDDTHAGSPDGKVRLQRQTKKRGGKAVIVISGIPGTTQELQAICKQLKQHCACGGSVKDGQIIVQNAQQEKVQTALTQLGYSSVWAGG